MVRLVDWVAVIKVHDRSKERDKLYFQMKIYYFVDEIIYYVCKYYLPICFLFFYAKNMEIKNELLL